VNYRRETSAVEVS